MSGHVCILLGGPDRRIEVDGKVYLFEMHPYCGPIPLNKNGEVSESTRPKRFWHAVSQWSQQGEKLEGDLCVWTEPPSRTAGMVKVGRNWVTPEMAARFGVEGESTP